MIILDELRDVLSHYPDHIQPFSQPDTLGSGGGLSGSQLCRWVAPYGTIVGRRWPTAEGVAERVHRIHQWVSLASHLPFVSVPYQNNSGQTFHVRRTTCWDLSPWLPGSPVLAFPIPSKVRAAFIALAQFHRSFSGLKRVGPSPGLRARHDELSALMVRGFDQVEFILQRVPLDGRAQLGRRWLAAARRLAPNLLNELHQVIATQVEQQPCLRDVRAEHFLFEGDCLTGLIDYGAMGEECVATDLARLQGEWLGHDPILRGEAIDAYNSVRLLSKAERSLIGVFERASAFLIGMHWLRWHYLEGRRFDDETAVERGLKKGLDRLLTLEGTGGIVQT